MDKDGGSEQHETIPGAKLLPHKSSHDQAALYDCFKYRQAPESLHSIEDKRKLVAVHCGRSSAGRTGRVERLGALTGTVDSPMSVNDGSATATLGRRPYFPRTDAKESVRSRVRSAETAARMAGAARRGDDDGGGGGGGGGGRRRCWNTEVVSAHLQPTVHWQITRQWRP